MKKVLKFLFSVSNEKSKNNKIYKVITVFGIKFKLLSRYKTLLNTINKVTISTNKIVNSACETEAKLNLLEDKFNQFDFKLGCELNSKLDYLFSEKLNTVLQKNISTALLHQKTFLPFKNKHQGQTMVLIGAGPSVNKFKKIDNAIYVGLNRAFKKADVDFDYLFAIDKIGLKDCEKAFAEYRTQDCTKFIGYQDLGEHWQIPEDYANSFNCLRYKTTIDLPQRFKPDIESHPLFNSCTVSIQAMQFILYTNPKTVYIVGLDCTMGKGGHFDGSNADVSFRNENPEENCLYHIEDWKKIKEFARVHYPDTEIISINPVGLKGVFKDEYYPKENVPMTKKLENNLDELYT